MGLPPSPTSKPSRRIAELDALRGLAALAVLLYHFLTRFQEIYGRQHPVGIDFNAGGYGVWLFFMLSGYVIFMTLDRSRSLFDFAVGRLSRLYPAFWVAVFVTYGVVKLCGLPGQEVSVHDALLNLTMLPRLYRVEFVDGVYWSLEPELYFYLCMAALFLLGCLRHVRPMLALWLLAAAFAHLVLGHLPETAMLYHLVGKLKAATNLEYIHLFAIGMIFYDVHRRTGTWTKGHLALLAASLGLEFWFAKIPEACVTTALAGLLFLATTGRMPFLNWRPLLWLGFISYPLYLTHQEIGYILLAKLDASGWNPYFATAAATVLSLGIAALISYGIEHPVMRAIRDAVKKQRQAAAELRLSVNPNEVLP